LRKENLDITIPDQDRTCNSDVGECLLNRKVHIIKFKAYLSQLLIDVYYIISFLYMFYIYMYQVYLHRKNL
jgi:hypothetical protein